MSSQKPEVDGRRAKGARRRRAIVDATLRVVARDGIAGVSHRNIAREAGVPAASVGYYFDSIDDLLVATLLDSVEVLIAEIDRMTSEVGSDEQWPGVVARMLARMIDEHRERTLAEYELYLLAARRPALRPAARRWIEVATGYVNGGEGGDPHAMRAFFAAIDGLVLQALVADEPPTAEELEASLRYVMQPGSYLRSLGVIS
ncbi:TetR family transcriptional regulator [Saccharopolyspora erythraea NRRL 2338]|uniref:DeoR-type transcriptional regulator n=2 Tax=Saccharopolyspora erythraea TaxID=1836 RepID=A4FQP6_SACEN|nr:TetR family transcriptional regulator [Saccharopolyspora erythraea]EQD87674.1 TetR family transcriptional regulator [Saccharopolyspora erythraea D]PFG92973.1 TetR family transcriptional regulator [Saccharopolyspora erythraea NRRL 2338]QRK89865.1 TetR family transcriptional regulator [Saccharopolyspora erythraea]CAM06371.1 putative DeoR-type transcriptional regulator [Saccharopolyspora erythraea NRRL 2338]